MMKQPPYVTKLRLSRLCRWLIALGVVKLTLFIAMVTGVPVPELRLDFVGSEKTAPVVEARRPAPVRLTAPVNVQTAERPEDLPAPASPASPPSGEPQGAAAAAAAVQGGPAGSAGGRHRIGDASGISVLSDASHGLSAYARAAAGGGSSGCAGNDRIEYSPDGTGVGTVAQWCGRSRPACRAGGMVA